MISSTVHLDATDVTDKALFCDQSANLRTESWSIRITTGDTQVWLTGTVDEFDEMLARLGEHVVTLRQRIDEKWTIARLAEAAEVGA